MDKFALTNAIYNMDTAFFKEGGGYPKFKSKHNNYKSYTTNYTNGNIKVDYEKRENTITKIKESKSKNT